MKEKVKLIGPFKQIVTLVGLPPTGPIMDNQLPILKNTSVLVAHGKIIQLGDFADLRKSRDQVEIEEINEELVLLPGFIDAHTHLCYAGTRSTEILLSELPEKHINKSQKPEVGFGIQLQILVRRPIQHWKK